MKTSSNMVNMLATTYNRHAKLQERFLWWCCHKGNEFHSSPRQSTNIGYYDYKALKKKKKKKPLVGRTLGLAFGRDAEQHTDKKAPIAVCGFSMMNRNFIGTLK